MVLGKGDSTMPKYRVFQETCQISDVYFGLFEQYLLWGEKKKNQSYEVIWHSPPSFAQSEEVSQKVR